MFPTNSSLCRPHAAANKPCTQYQIQDFSYQVHTQIKNCPQAWDENLKPEQSFFRSSYLQALENAPPQGMQFRYLILQQNNQYLGQIYVQIFELKLDKNNKNQEAQQASCMVKALGQALSTWLKPKGPYSLLICGNLLLTGDFGYQFKTSIPQEKQNQILKQTLEHYQQELKKEQLITKLILLKDFIPEAKPQLHQTLSLQGPYTAFELQPCMRLKFRPHWQNFQDYLQDLSSKYRVRAKRAAKKGQTISKCELSLQDLETKHDKIHQLYRQVAENVNFNAFDLDENYFYELKKQLGPAFKIHAYFIQDELVAFYTCIEHDHWLYAHFLGFDQNLNQEHQIYLNILYDLIQLGLNLNTLGLDLARTALEIKSSVGAEAQTMTCYIRHQNRLSNKLVQLVLHYMNRQEAWQARHPFKE